MKTPDGPRLYFSRKDFGAELAKWAIRQCPYAFPLNLERAVARARDLFPKDPEMPVHLDMVGLTHAELRHHVHDIIHRVPEIVLWNLPRSGHQAPFVVVAHVDHLDLYHNPDDDFIDLSALANNIQRSLWQEAVGVQVNKEPPLRPIGFWRRWWLRLRAPQGEAAPTAPNPDAFPPAV